MQHDRSPFCSTETRDATPLQNAHDDATALHRAGNFAQAADAYMRELALTPNDARLLSNFGGLLCSMAQFEASKALLTKAVSLAPDMPDAWNNLGNTLVELQDYASAITAYKQCLGLTPNHPLALSSLGVALDRQGHHAIAEKGHRFALRLDPDNPMNHLNLAVSLLAQGKYPEGFAEFEWRWKTTMTSHHGMDGPLWNGQPFEGKTLFIHTEGGFGDMLQFSRFIPFAAARGGHTVTLVRKELLRLMQVSFPDLHFVTVEDDIPRYHFQCPIMSLPLTLGITLDTIPLAEGYLKTTPAQDSFWQNLLSQDLSLSPLAATKPFKIGLVWAGSPHTGLRFAEVVDGRRSLSLATLAPLAQAAPNALFYSLQVGEQSAQAQHPPTGMTLIDHTKHLKDFSDTAALAKQLDLIIAVDTSTAHLAAGLGQPTWVLSRYDQCWRWLSQRTDSPWYKSLKLYQQAQPLDWTSPLEQLTTDLAKLNTTAHSVESNHSNA
jgi:Flp pilus assembly protein TadD